eukprot:NODE_477_length_1707_cov_91.842581_g389_i1.p1 GENE.NODE_477_length_1707_cov_91.842581_g389_i1~~NODE_477_length_1707_cov_91.842581_g389_i1.p1  ORF type:complete len:308 (-),score=39.33 NODE_477_length_1707_cov_91.842581_g389_i1:108-1031(-)
MGMQKIKLPTYLGHIYPFPFIFLLARAHISATIVPKWKERSMLQSMALARYPQLHCLPMLLLYQGFTVVCWHLCRQPAQRSRGERLLAFAVWLPALPVLAVVNNFVFQLQGSPVYLEYTSMIPELPRWPLRRLMPTRYWHGNAYADFTDACGAAFSGMIVGCGRWNALNLLRQLLTASLIGLPDHVLDCRRSLFPLLLALSLSYLAAILLLRPFHSMGDNCFRGAAAASGTLVLALLCLEVNYNQRPRAVGVLVQASIVGDLAISLSSSFFTVLRLVYQWRCFQLVRIAEKNFDLEDISETVVTDSY